MSTTTIDARRLVENFEAGLLRLREQRAAKVDRRHENALVRNQRSRDKAKALGICPNHLSRPVKVPEGRYRCEECDQRRRVLEKKYRERNAALRPMVAVVRHYSQKNAPRRKRQAEVIASGHCPWHITRPAPLAPGKNKCADCIERKRVSDQRRRRGFTITTP